MYANYAISIAIQFSIYCNFVARCLYLTIETVDQWKSSLLHFGVAKPCRDVGAAVKKNIY